MKANHLYEVRHLESRAQARFRYYSDAVRYVQSHLSSGPWTIYFRGTVCPGWPSARRDASTMRRITAPDSPRAIGNKGS